MFAYLVSTYHLHPIVDHFTIALLTFGVVAELLSTVATLLTRGKAGLVSSWASRLQSTALPLMIGGAASSVLSYLSGDAEADRLWDTISPAAQQILLASSGPNYLSHAILGQRLMYAFLVLAGWRVMLELSSRVQRTRSAFLIVAMVAAVALLYQGKTGGELVYGHGVGMPRTTTSAQLTQAPEDASAKH